MKKRVLFLTGAGFTAHSGITTYSLTQQIVNLDIQELYIDSRKPGVYFKDLLEKYYGDGDGDRISYVNFETIIYLLEEIFTFLVSQGSTNFNSRGIKPSFLEMKEVIYKHLEESLCNEHGINKSIKNLFCHYIGEIQSTLRDFDSDTSNKDMHLFCEFIRDQFPDTMWAKRIYTLNYDSWLNKNMDYHDGFDSSGNLDSQSVLKNTDSNIQYNLHGCVNWEICHPGMNLKYPSVKKSNRMFTDFRYMSPPTINREPLLLSPIITGYNKLTRMKYSPFLEFYYSFQRDLDMADVIISIGYGFGDTHINNMLSLYNKKVYIVDLKKESQVKDFMASLSFGFGNLIDYHQHEDGWFKSKDKMINVWLNGLVDFYNNFNQQT